MPLPYPKLLLLLSSVSDEEAPVPIVLKIYALILVGGGRESIIGRLPPYLGSAGWMSNPEPFFVDPQLTPTVHLLPLARCLYVHTLHGVIIFFPHNICSPAFLARTIIDPGCVLGKGQKIGS